MSSPQRDGQLWTGILLPVLTFVGTGIGVIGFVVFFGGFIVWARFDASGLPANEAVSEVARNDLIVTGASFLLPAVLAALATVGVAFVMWDLVIGNVQRRRADHATKAVAATAASLAAAQARVEPGRQLVETAKTRLEQARQDYRDAAETADRGATQQALDDAEETYRNRVAELSDLQTNVVSPATTAHAEAMTAEQNATNLRPLEKLALVFIGAVPMAVAEYLVIRGGSGELNFWPVVLLAGVAILTIAVAVVLVSRTQSFAWFAVGVFVGVAFLMAFSTYERTRAETKESPFAAVVNGEPLTGFFLAETPDAVYVARPARSSTPALALDHADITVTRVPKADMAEFTFGPLMKETRAYRRALGMAMTLCQAATETTKATTTITSVVGTGAKGTKGAKPTKGAKAAPAGTSQHTVSHSQPTTACSSAVIGGLRSQIANP